MLAQFERYVAEDAPLSVVLPTVYRKNEQRYRGYSIRRLCRRCTICTSASTSNSCKGDVPPDHFPPVVMNPQDANVEFIRDNVELVPIGGRKGASRRKGPCRTRPACCAWCRAKCGAARRSATSALEEGINRLPGFSPELQGSTSRKRSRLEAHLRLYDQAIEKGRFVPALHLFTRNALLSAVALLRGIHFHQIAARLGGRMLGGQRLVHVARLHAVDDAHRARSVAGEHP